MALIETTIRNKEEKEVRFLMVQIVCILATRQGDAALARCSLRMQIDAQIKLA